MSKSVNAQDSYNLCKHVYDVYSLFCKKQSIDEQDFILSPIHVKSAIDNALIDLNRLKDFHMPDIGKCPDRHKIAGFVAKWIAKTKPIQITKKCAFGPQTIKVDQVLKLNASFAVNIFISFLDPQEVPVNITSYLQYWFEFRDERGDVLAFIAFCCEEIAKHNSKNI